MHSNRLAVVALISFALSAVTPVSAQVTDGKPFDWLPNNGVSYQCGYAKWEAIDRAIRLGVLADGTTCHFRNPSDSSPNVVFEVRLAPGGTSLDIAINLLVKRDSFDHRRIIRHPAFDTISCADAPKLAAYIMPSVVRHQQISLPQPKVASCTIESAAVDPNSMTNSPFGNRLGSGSEQPIQRRSLILSVDLADYRARLSPQLKAKGAR